MRLPRRSPHPRSTATSAPSPSGSPDISPAYRRALLRAWGLADAAPAPTTPGPREPYDLLVVGAGVTGAGIALDAAMRGLRVLLVDAQDLAFGTSRWSSKLAHGGLRYLASGNVGIAHRSARERHILLTRTAPHLTRTLAQVVPVMREFGVVNNLLPRLGFIAGDALRIAAGTRADTLPRSRTVSADTVAQLCPTVDRSALSWGYVNYDGQLIDDARLVVALARTARSYGADVLTHARVLDVADAPGAGGGAQVTLELRGDTEIAALPASARVEVQARAVVNATGVWAGDLDEQITVRPSRGTHVVVDAARLGNPTGSLTVPVPGSTNRFCFVLPAQLGRCYIGLTDEAAERIDEEPAAPAEDVEWILGVINQALATDLSSADVIGTFAGLRPLVHFHDRGGSTADLSREHIILRSGPMLTVTGGKLTEYRLMAEQTVDRAIAEFGGAEWARLGPSRTAWAPLVGADTYRSGATDRGVAAAQRAAGIPTGAGDPTGASSLSIADADPVMLAEMHQRLGAEVERAVAACVIPRPLEPVAPGVPLARAEVSWAVTHEGAVTAADVLDRRTRLGLVAADRAAAEPVLAEVWEALRAAER